MEKNHNNTSSLKNKDDGSVNLLDLFFYLLSYWYWFVLSLLVCVGIASYKYCTSPLIYRADTTIIIKDPSNTRMSTKLDQYSQLINRTSVSNEILQFKSKRLMTEVVRRLDANVNYQYEVKLRSVELYNNTPVKVLFSPELEDVQMSLTVVPLDDNTVEVTYAGEKNVYEINSTIEVNGGTLTLVPTQNFTNDEFRGKPVYVSKRDAVKAAIGFISNLSIQQLNDDASILTFYMTDQSVNRAMDILNMLIDVYNEDAINDKNQVTINTAQFISERIGIIGRELEDVEGKLQKFQTDHNLTDANEAANIYLEQTRTTNAQVVEYETQIRWAQFIRDYLTDPANEHDLIPTSIAFDDLRVEGLISQHNSLKMDRDKLVSTSSEQNPVIIGMDNNIASIRESIIISIDNLIRSINIKKDDVAKQEEQARQKFAEMPSTSRELLTIERQQNIKEQLYLFLLNKREENALAQSMVENNARVMDPAEGSSLHVAPNRNKMLLMGILVGLFIPLFILVVRLILDNKIHSRKDLEGLVTIPVIGEIPVAVKSHKMRDEQKSPVIENIMAFVKKQQWLQKVLKSPVVVKVLSVFKRKNTHKAPMVHYESGSNNLIAETFRILCTNLEFMSEKHKVGEVVTVSSFTVGAGKTFTILNMASCLADNNKKVLLIDLDLRKRSISRRLGVCHKVKGVTNYLFDDTVGIDEIRHRNVLPGVDMLPAGVVPPNPVELLRRNRLDELISAMRAEYDYILVDNVPTDVVADSMVINRFVDITLFVIRMGQLDRRVLPMLENMYNENRYNNMGLVLNGTDIRHRYGFSYGFGYGYGYGEKDRD